MEPTIVADPQDARRLVAASFSYESQPPGPGVIWPRVHTSSDQGTTWKTTILPRGQPTDPESIFFYNNAGDPALAFSGNTLVLAGIAAHGLGAGQSNAPNILADYSVFIARSTGGGNAFDPPRIIHRGTGSYNDLLDMPGLAAGPDGTLLLTFTRFHVQAATQLAQVIPSDIMFSTSSDAGTTWSPPALVEAGNNHWSRPLVTQNDTWLVAMHGTLPNGSAPQAPTPLKIAKSNDHGESWNVIAVGTMADGNRPMLAEAPDGAVLLAYAEPNQNGAAPALRVSSNEGTSWSEPTILDASSVVQPLTSVTVDAHGVAYSAWYGGSPGAMTYRAGAVDGGMVVDAVTIERGFAAGVGQREYAGLVGLPSGAYAVYVAGNAPQTDIHGALLTVDGP